MFIIYCGVRLELEGYRPRQIQQCWVYCSWKIVRVYQPLTLKWLTLSLLAVALVSAGRCGGTLGCQGSETAEAEESTFCTKGSSGNVLFTQAANWQEHTVNRPTIDTTLEMTCIDICIWPVSDLWFPNHKNLNALGNCIFKAEILMVKIFISVSSPWVFHCLSGIPVDIMPFH